MGNCQAAEAATVVLQHPGGGKVDRIYWSVSVNEVMSRNPGHYVALVVAAKAAAAAATPVKQLKLLRPDDTLVVGKVYRLISFEDVVSARRCVKLGRLLKERGPDNVNKNENQAGFEHCSNSQSYSDKFGDISNGIGSSSQGVGRFHGERWRPALQTISELGA